MIPKAVIHAVAKEESLRDTTVEKDYVLGWMLHGIAHACDRIGPKYRGVCRPGTVSPTPSRRVEAVPHFDCETTARYVR